MGEASIINRYLIFKINLNIFERLRITITNYGIFSVTNYDYEKIF